MKKIYVFRDYMHRYVIDAHYRKKANENGPPFTVMSNSSKKPSFKISIPNAQNPETHNELRPNDQVPAMMIQCDNSYDKDTEDEILKAKSSYEYDSNFSDSDEEDFQLSSTSKSHKKSATRIRSGSSISQSSYLIGQKIRNKRRKDPLQHKNRFKFDMQEDQLLKTLILDQFSLKRKEKGKFSEDASLADKMKEIQSEHFDRRPLFELVRRCFELLDSDPIYAIQAEIVKKPLKKSKKKSAAMIKQEPEQQAEEESKNEVSKNAVDVSREWTEEEDRILIQAVMRHGMSSWSEINNELDGRKPSECRYRYIRIDPNVIRVGTWDNIINDVKLILGVKMFKMSHWADISEHVFNRTIQDTQCLERYTNILDPSINHKPWTAEDDEKLLNKYKEMPNQWAIIAKHMEESLPGLDFMIRRTDNQVKRRYNHLINLKKKPPKREKVLPKIQRNKDRVVPHSDLDAYGGFALAPTLTAPQIGAHNKAVRKATLGKRVKKEKPPVKQKEMIIKIEAPLEQSKAKKKQVEKQPLFATVKEINDRVNGLVDMIMAVKKE